VSREAGTIVIPGHGRLYDQYDVIEYRDMITIIFRLSKNPLDFRDPCVPGYEGREPGGGVPHFAPDQNPFLDEFMKLHNLPREAVLGLSGDAVSGVPQEGQEPVRAAAVVHRRLRRRRQLRQTTQRVERNSFLRSGSRRRTSTQAAETTEITEA
jgi:hypothetical protein